MSNPNFVSELVLMAKAMEELPIVQAELSAANARNGELSETVQRLELRIIDLKNELDAAHAAISKAEVERDHAERMFLETDDRLNQFRQLVQRFRAEVETYDAAVPPKEVSADPGVSTEHYASVPGTEYSEPRAEPTPAPAVMSEDHIDGPFPYQSGQSVADPINASSTASPSPSADTPAPSMENVGTSSSEVPSTLASDAGVSVSDYPTSANSPNAASASPVDSAPTQADAPLDVGYHNEPAIGTSGDHEADWAAWQRWQMCMDAKYGVGHWPQRPTPEASRASQYSF